MRLGRLRTTRASVAILLIGSLTACGGAATGSAEGDTAIQVRSPAQELKTAKKALLSPADLGKPWVLEKEKPTAEASAEPSSEASGEPSDEASGTATDEPSGEASEDAEDEPDEFCPGQPDIFVLVSPRSAASITLTEGAKAGVAILSLDVATLHPGQERAWRDAVRTAAEGCRTYRQKDGFFVTLTNVEKPRRIQGAEEVLAFIERIHEDLAYKKLLYIRHYVYTRSARLVTTAQYAAIHPKTDPTGSDTTEVFKLAARQVKKANAVFND